MLEAKVPAVKRRTSCVYADLRELISEMELRKAKKWDFYAKIHNIIIHGKQGNIKL